ncbi:MAG: SDR family oxidoreductase [Pseudomonadota bacterium]
MTRNVVISGANRGIGLELCRRFRDRGDHVVALCRTAGAQLDRLGVQVLEGIDVTVRSSLTTLIRQVELPRVDILINNAGVLFPDRLDSLDDEGIERMRTQFDVNALGPLNLTLAMKPALATGSKVIIVTSRMGSMADNTSGGQYGYRASKAAVNMIGRSLAHDLADEGIAVSLIHPGYVRTDMTGGEGLVNADEAAGNIVDRIDWVSMDNTGQFFHANGDTLPW